MGQNPLHDELKGKLSDLLALVGTQSFEFLCMAFPAHPEGEIALALVRLALAGEIQIDGEGVRKREADAACDLRASSDAAAPSAEAADQDLRQQKIPPDADANVGAPPMASSAAAQQEEAVPGSQEVEPRGWEAPSDTARELSAEPEEDFEGIDWSEGASAETLSESYLPDDEIETLVEGLKCSPNSGIYDGDALIGDDSEDIEDGRGFSNVLADAACSDERVRSAVPLRFGFLLDSDTVDALHLSTRPSNALAHNGVRTVADLVARLDEVSRMRSMGPTSCNEINQALARGAGALGAGLSDDQWRALCAASGNSCYVFDASGVLRAVSDSSPTIRPQLDPPLAHVSVAALGLKDTTERRLRVNGIRTVGDAVALGAEGLLSVPRVGVTFVNEVADALERYCLRNGFSVPSGMRLDDAPVAQSFAPLPLDAFLADCSSVAFRVAERALRVCQERDYPVRRDSFLILFVPRAETLMAEGCDEEECSRRIVELFEEGEALCDVLTRRFGDDALVSVAATGEGRAVPDGPVWEKVARRLAAKRSDVEYSEDERMLRVKVPTAREWAESVPGREGSILRARLGGATLQEVGDSEGMTRERARQLAERALRRRPALAEDRWLPLFERYAFTCQQLEALTEQDASAYHYLSMVASTRKADRLDLSALVDDPDAPQELKDRLLDMRVVSDVVKDDGAVVRTTKEDIITYLLRKHASAGPLSLEQLLSLYEGFLREHALESVSRLASNGARAFGAYLDRCDNVLYARVPPNDQGERKGLRFYDAASKDFSGLRGALERLSSRNIEVSATWLARLPEVQEAMRVLDLRNEYELYAIMYRYCQDVPGIELGRVPMLKLGVADRTAQVEQVIEEVGPATSDVIAAEYERRYGVRRDTFCGTFLRDFYLYCHDGVYAIERAELDERQMADLRTILSDAGEYCSAKEVEARFRQLHPEWTGTLAAAGNLRGAGFVRSGELLVREGVDEHVAFARLIASHDRFTLGEGDFPPEVSGNEAFVSELNKALRSWQVVEVAERRYYGIEEFFTAEPPLSESDFQAFLDSVVASASPDVPFNGFSLRKRGVTAKLDAAAASLGLGMDLADNVIQLGYVGGRLKRTTINDTPVFCKAYGQFDSNDLLAWLLEVEGPLSARDVVKRLKELFDIDLIPAQVRGVARRGAMVIDPATDVISLSTRSMNAEPIEPDEGEEPSGEERW